MDYLEKTRKRKRQKAFDKAKLNLLESFTLEDLDNLNNTITNNKWVIEMRNYLNENKHLIKKPN